jgi:hypothetical protein
MTGVEENKGEDGEEKEFPTVKKIRTTETK